MDHAIPGDEDRLASNRRLTQALDRAAGEERRQLAFLALLALLPFVLLAAWTRVAPPAPWEAELVLALAVDAGLDGDIVRSINAIGNPPVWAVVVAVSAAVIGAARGLSAALSVALSFAADLVAFVFKLLVERDRPATAAVEQFFGSDNFSFPSGHAVRAAALVAVVVWLLAPVSWRFPLAVIGGLSAGLAMGYARVSLGVHWPTDVLGGILLGIGWFALTALVASRRPRGLNGNAA